jgi:hypothetical protein
MDFNFSSVLARAFLRVAPAWAPRGWGARLPKKEKTLFLNVMNFDPHYIPTASAWKGEIMTANG